MKKNRKRRFLIFFILALPILLFIGLGYATRLSFLQIRGVNITEAKAINKTDVEEYIYDNLNGRYLYLYNKNNILIYPKKNIEDNFTNIFPRSYNLQVKLNKRFEIDAIVTERSPFVLWCGANKNNLSNWNGENENSLVEKCYMADKTGFIFGEAPEYSGVVYPKIYFPIPDLEENEPPISKNIYPKEEFMNVSKYVEFIQKNNIQISEISNIEKNYYIFTSSALGHNNSFEFKINSKQDPATIQKNFENALVGSSLSKIQKSGYDNIKYIDLRFEDKIFYK